MYDEDEYEFDNVFMESVVEELDRQETQFLQSQDPNRQETLNDLPPGALRSQARNSDRKLFANTGSRNDITAFNRGQLHIGTSDTNLSNQSRDQVVETLRNTVEHLKIQLSQDEEVKQTALREMERYRAELKFKTQELENTKLALSALKAKQKQSDVSAESSMSSQTTVSRKKSLFPTGASFSKPASRNFSKRESSRMDASPSSTETRVETMQESASLTKKRKRHADENIAAKQPKIKHNDEESIVKDKKIIQLPRDSRAKLLWSVLTKDFNDSQVQTHGVIKDLTYQWSTDRTVNTFSFFKGRLLDNAATKNISNARLAMLLDDINKIMMEDEKPYDFRGVLERVLQLLGAYITISTDERKISSILDAVQILHTLSATYAEANDYLLHDLTLGDLSILEKLASCLELFKRLKRRDQPTHIMGAEIREVSRRSFRDMTLFCKQHKLSAKDALGISEETEQLEIDLVLYILNIFINVIQSANKESNERLQFILRRKAFVRLLSGQVPYIIISKALDIMILLVEGPILSFFSSVNDAGNDDPSAINSVVALLSLPLPNARLENEWYNIRIKVVKLLETMVQFGYPDQALQETCNEIALLLVALMNKECIMLSKRNSEFSLKLPKKKSFEFLIHGADLMCGILNVYPSIYQTHCKKEAFMHRVVRIFRVARDNLGLHHGTVTKLGKLVTSLETVLSAQSSDDAKTQL